MSKRKNITIENVTVIDAGAKGKSIAKAPDGRVIFLNNALPGDVVDVQTTKKKSAYYEGFATHFHKHSDLRTSPMCTHFGYCGGCKWQDLKYESQLFYKQKEVENNLVRLGHLSIPPLMPIIGSDDIYFYRNKMEFSFSDMRWLTPEEIQKGEEVADRNALGFHIAGAWDKILDIEHCYLQADPSNAIRQEIKRFALANEMPFYSPRQQTGLLRTMMIRISSTGEIMVVIQFFRNDPKITLLLDHLATSFPQISSLQYCINSKGNDAIYDQEIICYKGNDCIYEEMEGLRFKINAKSFYQTNSKQAYKLYQVARDFADLKGDELVYDLYTGTGTIAQFVAKKARKVVGVEAVPEAISDAKDNAQANGISNAIFYVGDMKQVFNEAFIQDNGTPDVIITDPPRDGMHKDVVAQILQIAPQKIVYVSCNSATQARDLSLMDEFYKVTKVQPVDMFPQTYHVENVVLLEKK